MRPYTKAADEILSDIILPPVWGWRSVYLKLRCRGYFDFPMLGVAVALRQSEDGLVEDARITLGAVASHPVEASAAAARLIGQRLTPPLLAEVAALAAKPARPLDNADLSMSYRKQVTTTYVRRALDQLM